MALDPVCGMTVDPAKAAGAFEYKGTKYYFCSKHCLHSFQSDPEPFLSKKSGAAHTHAAVPLERIGRKAPPKPGPRGAKYTCPMHPEIVQDGPGSCPKCGMALMPMIPATPAAAEYTCPMHPEVRSPKPGNCQVRHGARTRRRSRRGQDRAA